MALWQVHNYGFYVFEQTGDMTPTQADVDKYSQRAFDINVFLTSYKSVLSNEPVARTWAYLSVSPFSSYQLGKAGAVNFTEVACSSLGKLGIQVKNAAMAQGIATTPTGVKNIAMSVSAVFTNGPMNFTNPCHTSKLPCCTTVPTEIPDADYSFYSDPNGTDPAPAQCQSLFGADGSKWKPGTVAPFECCNSSLKGVVPWSTYLNDAKYFTASGGFGVSHNPQCISPGQGFHGRMQYAFCTHCLTIT